MAEEKGRPLAVSNTGPLISAFQSDSLGLVTALFGAVHTPEACLTELNQHGWGEVVSQVGSNIVGHKLADAEIQQARELARQIAAHPASKDREPSNHLGEAEAMVLTQRAEFAEAVLLLDELAARAVATELRLTLSGFAGVLLLAVEEGLITPEELKERLERCRQQGTHYSVAFIDQIYREAKAGEK
ncbi:MAG: hypothetical protein ACRDH2_02210 [Anaerolineales bacterium]